MKTILTYSFILLTSSFAVFATPSWWVEITSKECNNAWMGGTDATPSTANLEKYTAYYCTVEAAEQMFGTSDRAGIESYMRSNHAAGSAALAENATLVDQGGYYEAGQYTFIEYMTDAVAKGDYVAVAFYGTTAFRVFGSDNAVWDSGTLTFDDQGAAGTVGNWYSIPEPTSGMLLLLGFAGLALRRRKV